jgi:hypothetical protein
LSEISLFDNKSNSELWFLEPVQSHFGKFHLPAQRKTEKPVEKPAHDSKKSINVQYSA